MYGYLKISDLRLQASVLFVIFLSDALQRMVRIVTLVNGESCVVQAENSQVKLHVPKGVHGAILANIQTNHARFMHHVPDDDCLVSPICEYHLQKPYCEHTLSKRYGIQIPPHSKPEDIKYRIEIPHIVKDIANVRPHIRVRHGNLHSGLPALQKHSAKTQKGKFSFDLDEDYVTIYTNHFSGYIVSAKCINCCGQSANVHVFASLRNIPDTKPLARVKVYLSSNHSDIQDYMCVRNYLNSRKRIFKLEIIILKI